MTIRSTLLIFLVMLFLVAAAGEWRARKLSAAAREAAIEEALTRADENAVELQGDVLTAWQKIERRVKIIEDRIKEAEEAAKQMQEEAAEKEEEKALSVSPLWRRVPADGVQLSRLKIAKVRTFESVHYITVINNNHYPVMNFLFEIVNDAGEKRWVNPNFTGQVRGHVFPLTESTIVVSASDVEKMSKGRVRIVTAEIAVPLEK